MSRRNEPAIPVFEARRAVPDPSADPVRNGQRWQVLAVDREHDRIAARRLEDGARVVLSGDYLREHVSYGYAVTVHAARGVTADTAHAVLGESTRRSLLYVAMTRGRETNHAYLYERLGGETEHEHPEPQSGMHVARRGTGHQAAQLVRGIIGHRNEQPRTAHDVAAQTEDHAQLPARVQSLLARRAAGVARRRAAYQQWRDDRLDRLLDQQQWIDHQRHRSRGRGQSRDYGLEL